MSRHPSDPVVASLVRNARLAAAANQYPTRTRTVGDHGARQYSTGSLVVETGRADVGVSAEVGQARREKLADELERRRMVEAADAARRDADSDRQQAQRERDQALERARHRGGPDPDFATLALVAIATMTVGDDVARVIDAAILDDPDLSTADAQELGGDRMVGLTPTELSTELASAGASPDAVNGLPHTGVDDLTPAQLVGQGTPTTPPPSGNPAISLEVEDSPEIG